MPVSLTEESDVDVLIIGAGPAGLMCANALGKAGVNVRVVDQRPIQVEAGQADGIQPRIVEVFQSYGLADRLLEQAAHVHMVAFYNPGPNGGIERTGRASDVTAPTARYPFEVALHQGGIEAIFLDSMRASGVEVERPIIPTAIEVTTDGSEWKDSTSNSVRVVLKHLEPLPGQSGTEVVYAKFVVGADGAHSWVRKQFNIPMEGEQTDYIWGVVDIIPDTDFPDIRNRCAIHSHNGSCMIIPREGDRIRLYIQLTDKDMVDPATGRINKDRMGPQQLLEVAQKSMYPYRISTSHDVHWWTLYIIGQRVASKYSVQDRVFIAGDACHTHSPKAGQGMNASMNDTHNLAWKLAYVLRGWADVSLLKTYESERRKYAQELIEFDKVFSKQFSDRPTTEKSENGVTHEQFLATFQTFGGFTSGIGVHYSPSPIVDTRHQSYASKLIIGQRMLPHEFIRAADARPFNLHDMLPSDTRFKVLVFAGNTADKTQLKRVRALAAELDKPNAFLKRFRRGALDTVFDILCISSAKKEDTSHLEIPELLRPHWSKVLLDDVDMYRRCHAGGGYEYYGIDPHGAIVVVRPDGYVGTVASFEHLDDVNQYFASFLLAPTP